jgi:hypothetical protein
MIESVYKIRHLERVDLRTHWMVLDYLYTAMNVPLPVVAFTRISFATLEQKHGVAQIVDTWISPKGAYTMSRTRLLLQP